ncbi:MAG: hypothetical protein CM15mP76_13490 [Prochlorococcus sp.]|nr:MAG: hypothetical protein CM15mP76_13490 [Prochlorococcus sp.]
MNQNEKPFQLLAWIATAILILAALLASFVPALEYHHWAFIIANSYGLLLVFMERNVTNCSKCRSYNNICIWFNLIKDKF